MLPLATRENKTEAGRYVSSEALKATINFNKTQSLIALCFHFMGIIEALYP